MSTERRARLDELRKERAQLNLKVEKLTSEIAQLDLQERREEYPCVCVKLNRDIEVYDMQEQERRGRNPLGLGLVSECLTARKSCDYCNGTGKPKR